MTRAAPLAVWYAEHGRHDLPWRRTRDRWAVLVSEVMLAQTQAARVRDVWPTFMARYPSPAAMAGVGLGTVITEWGHLGYPRRARWLWESARLITEQGWPVNLRSLPGVGRYTAAALAAQCDDADVPAVEVNVRRVVERVIGRRSTEREAEQAAVLVGRGLRGRDRLLALMDLGALVCRARGPECAACPLRRRCATRGPLDGERRARQGAFAGSFRQRRGKVLARLRAQARVPAGELDAEALASLVADGLAQVTRNTAHLP
ncbi:MAG: A/G-specific adenine glycosylase [Actinobacteria bacterium]|nr:A/G-specific adenine glycosylase [Actinomycetota bacterium]